MFISGKKKGRKRGKEKIQKQTKVKGRGSTLDPHPVKHPQTPVQVGKLKKLGCCNVKKLLISSILDKMLAQLQVYVCKYKAVTLNLL